MLGMQYLGHCQRSLPPQLVLWCGGALIKNMPWQEPTTESNNNSSTQGNYGGGKVWPDCQWLQWLEGSCEEGGKKLATSPSQQDLSPKKAMKQQQQLPNIAAVVEGADKIAEAVLLTGAVWATVPTANAVATAWAETAIARAGGVATIRSIYGGRERKF